MNGCQQVRVTGSSKGKHLPFDSEQCLKLAVDVLRRLRMSTAVAGYGQVGKRRGAGACFQEGRGVCRPQSLWGAKVPQQLPQLAVI
jgi:hypothetical protein